MKTITNKFLVLFLFSSMILFSNCTVRLVDFTTISTKNVNLNVDRSKGKKTEGKKSYFLGIGFNLKDAIDLALENAGTKYDMLIDGVVRYSNFPFVVVVKVEGIAVSSSAMKDSMGSVEYEEWLNNQQGVYTKSRATD
ncbi:MAG: hypothetical protein AAGG75_20750 [Bacteroidota bacterium]